MAVEMGSGPELEHQHHHHTGRGWLDITLAVSAVFISLMSLYLAIQHGRMVEKMVEASTWAYVTADYSNSDRDYTFHTRLSIKNKGVGPAKVESVEVLYNNVAQPGPAALLKAILPNSAAERRHGVLTSDVTDVVLSAKEELNFVDFNVKSFTPEEYAIIRESTQKIEFRICYCSVLDRCAVVDTRKAHRPVPLKACSVPATPFQEGM